MILSKLILSKVTSYEYLSGPICCCLLFFDDERRRNISKPSAIRDPALPRNGNEECHDATPAFISDRRILLLHHCSLLFILRRPCSSSRVFLRLQPRLQRYSTHSPARADVFDFFRELTEVLLPCALARLFPLILNVGCEGHVVSSSDESQQRSVPVLKKEITTLCSCTNTAVHFPKHRT